VHVDEAVFATFPDAAVVCGPQASADKDANALTNPSVLVEVTSPSTEFYDRGEKLKMYQQLPSLKVVLLVSHRAQRVTLVRRTASGWDEIDCRGGEVVACTEPNFQFSVDELYEGVALEA
jgi:Uma2 family endonuclease